LRFGKKARLSLSTRRGGDNRAREGAGGLSLFAVISARETRTADAVSAGEEVEARGADPAARR